MDRKTKTIIALVGSILISTVGILRIFSESLPLISLFVAYIFAVTGLIGAVANSLILSKTN
jgi:hypothetical protein